MTRFVLGVALAILILSLGFAAAVFFGVVVIAPEGAPAQVSDRQPSQQQQQVPGGPAPGAANTSSQRNAPPPQAKVVRQENFDDWIYTCVAPTEGAEVRCSINQLLSDARNNVVLFQWRILQDGEGGLTGVWQTRNSVLLPPGISLDLGDEKPIVLPYETCGNGLCQVVAKLGTNFVETLSKAEKAVVTIVARGGQKLNFPLSVKGLANGLTALKSPAPPANPGPLATPPPATLPANQ